MPDLSREYGLHWFRRDLRVTGNPALLWNSRRHSGRVLGVFLFDATFLSRPDFSPSRFAFFLDTLASLREELRSLGGDLLVLEGGIDRTWSELVTTLSRSRLGKPAVVSFNRDYEPFARERDARITSLLETNLGVQTHTERDHLLIEPQEIRAGSKGYYQVFTPFARRWFEALSSSEVQARIESALERPKRLALTWDRLVSMNDRLEHYREMNSSLVAIPVPRAGIQEARKCVERFRPRLKKYEKQRDLPAEPGTSHISIFLKNGSLTVAQVLAKLQLSKARFRDQRSETKFVKELAWREFYYHILWHCPRVEQEAFLTKYKDLAWENRTDLFEAWTEGKTGYPIVDAGMRQLKETGWMHNRVRMITASFLVKDLLIDWRWGERHFMKLLLDGDLAPNNGGWQWAASTGCDPQPWFRVFNPTLQARKFDPTGDYIRKWCPERASLKGKALHEPVDPVVDHGERRVRALELYARRRS